MFEIPLVLSPGTDVLQRRFNSLSLSLSLPLFLSLSVSSSLPFYSDTLGRGKRVLARRIRCVVETWWLSVVKIRNTTGWTPPTRFPRERSYVNRAPPVNTSRLQFAIAPNNAAGNARNGRWTSREIRRGFQAILRGDPCRMADLHLRSISAMVCSFAESRDRIRDWVTITNYHPDVVSLWLVLSVDSDLWRGL